MEQPEKPLSKKLKEIALSILLIDQEIYMKRLYLSESECRIKLIKQYKQEIDFWTQLCYKEASTELEIQSVKNIAQRNIRIYQFLLNKLQRENKQSAKFI